MSSSFILTVPCTLLLLASCSGPAPRTVIPQPSQETRAASAGWHGGRPWIDQHLDGVKIAAGGPLDLMFLGDSITQSWGGRGRQVGSPAAAVLEKWFSRLKVGNLGISGDRTQHLLWRIENGTLDGADPSAIVILIGTNNITHDPPADIARGIEAVVEATRIAAPDSRIILHPIFPRGKTAEDPGRQDVEATNARIQPLARRDGVEILDLEDVFLGTDQMARSDLYRGDYLHLSPAGYEAWARALVPRLEAIGLTVPVQQ